MIMLTQENQVHVGGGMGAAASRLMHACMEMRFALFERLTIDKDDCNAMT
jgi:hypothetical protein